MNVLLLGSGGREHALAIAINKSKSLDKLYCAPGNTGTEKLCMNVSLDIYSDELYDFCEKKQISLVVIGPEQPLVDGISDKLREKGIKVFGPNKNAAMIEGDKSFSKALMKKYGIPTARFEVFTKRTHSIALNYLKSTTYPLVVKALDGDKGKNTGGMGAYAPAKLIDSKLLDEIKRKIVKPTLLALNEENRKYIGCLYAGIIVTKEGPKVIEFNCRFGDPETQVVLPLCDGDFVKLFYSAASEKLDRKSVQYNGGSSVCVVAASSGYPDNYEKGFEIKGLEKFNESEEIIIYHAGTKSDNNKILTNGGRVLGVTSVIKNNDLKSAKKLAYKALAKIKFDNIYYRNDIADKGL